MQNDRIYCSDVPGIFSDSLRLPFIEGMPTKDKVAAMRKWLSTHADLYKNETVVLYHATGGTIPVLEQGLKPTSAERRRSYQSQSGYVYLAATPDRAKTFGDLGNQGITRIYAVRLLVRRLKADLDQLNNQRSVGQPVGNSVAESILYGGGARFKGAIPVWDVAEVFLGPDGKFQAGMPDDVRARRHQDALDDIARQEKLAAKGNRRLVA